MMSELNFKQTPTPTQINVFATDEMNEINTYNYPNPFNVTTTLRFSLAAQSEIVITIYDINGKTVWNKKISEGETNIGINRVTWAGVNDNEIQVSSGTYIMVIESADAIVRKKIALIR